MKLAVLIVSTLLFIFSSNAKAEIISTSNNADQATVINWSAVCTDCMGTRGQEAAPGDWQNVSGSLTVENYEAGASFDLNVNNLLGFSYNGPSNHLPSLSSTNIMRVAGFANDDLSSVAFNLVFEQTIMTYGTDENGFIQFFGSEGTMKSVTFHITFESAGTWGISSDFSEEYTPGPDLIIDNSGLDDIGNSATFSLESVPEPSTLAIFGLGLLGLVRVNKKAKRA